MSDAVPGVPRVLAPLARRMADQHSRETFQRDPATIARMIPLLNRYSSYFSPEVRGLDNLPTEGPVLVVGNHSGLFWLPDACIVAQAILARRGVEQPAYGLAYDLLFAVPGYGPLLRKMGGIPAGNDEADAALDSGALVLDFPGGDWESSRPWTHRDKIDLAGRKGFVRLALRHRVRVVPVVSHGAQHSIVVLARGDRLARGMHLDRMHIHVFPIMLSPPFGISAIATPPFPAKITVQFLPPLRWRGGIAAAGDEARVQDCYDEVTDIMQAAMDRIADEVPHPLLRGTASLAKSIATAPFRALTRS